MSAWPTAPTTSARRASTAVIYIEAVLAAAREAGADAVHPGYGLLSENAGFAAWVMAAGLTWIGPAPATIDAMGDKGRAPAIAAEAGVPVLPGSPRFSEIDADEIAAHGATAGFPLLVKAAGGWAGGIGMRRVRTARRISPPWSRRRAAWPAARLRQPDRLSRALRADGAPH